MAAYSLQFMSTKLQMCQQTSQNSHISISLSESGIHLPEHNASNCHCLEFYYFFSSSDNIRFGAIETASLLKSDEGKEGCIRHRALFPL